MMILVMLTIVSLLASWLVPEVNALGPVHFDFPLFDSSSIPRLAFLFNSSIDTAEKVLKITNTNEIWCDTHVCRGQIFFREPIKFHDRSRSRTYSFSTSFVFRLTILGNVRAGEGFLFLLIDDPFGNNRSGIGDYFGAFPSTGTPYTPTIAVEFDTLRHDEISDIDDNHIGVDINNPISNVQESCDSLNISLYEGQKLIAWIEYHDSIKKLQVRLANWTSGVIRPADPLIDMDLDLANIVDDTMYVGFSGLCYQVGVQDTDILSWFFHSELESPPIPPALIQTSHNRTGFKINTSHNRTRSKEENTILGFCIGGGLFLVLAAGGCFWLGYQWRGRLALAAKEKAGDPKNKKEKSEFAAGNVGDEQRKTFDEEGHFVSDEDVEVGTFGSGVFIPRSSRSSRIVKTVYMNNDAADGTITATKKKRSEERDEFMPKRVKSARQLEADDAETHAFKNGVPDIQIVASPFRRGLQSFDAVSTRGTGWTPATSILGGEFVSLPKEETTRRADLPVPTLFPREREAGKGGSPTNAAASLSFRDIALPHSGGQTSRGGPSTAAIPKSSVHVKRRQAIQPRKPERSPVSTPRRESKRTPRKNPESSSTPGGTLMYTNTLYDSHPGESHDRSPRLPKSAEADLYMDENINIRPTPENMYDRPPVRTDYGEEIVERIFEVPIIREHEVDVDAERIFYVPDSPDVSQRDTITIIPLKPTATRTPVQSSGGTRLSSPKAQSPGGSRLSSPKAQSRGRSGLSSPKTSFAGISITPSMGRTSRSSSTDNTKESESRRVKQTPHWRY